jgi:hypothetical protein
MSAGTSIEVRCGRPPCRGALNVLMSQSPLKVNQGLSASAEGQRDRRRVRVRGRARCPLSLVRVR